MKANLAPRRHPSDIQDGRLLAVLERYVPSIIARSIVERARREATSGPDVSWTDPNGLLDRISVGVRLFAAPEHVSAILRGITDLAAADDQEGPPSSHSFADDGGPTSTLKPSSPRGRAEEARVRVEDQPPTRRDIGQLAREIPAAPASSSGVGGAPPSRREPPPSRDAPASRDAPPSREMPTAREAGGTRDAAPPAPSAPSTPAATPARRDADIAGFSGSRGAPEQAPPSRGVFPTTAGSRLPLTPRTTGRGPSIVAIPAIPPPPRAANLRLRPTPPTGTPMPPMDRASSSITQQSMPRQGGLAPPPPGSRGPRDPRDPRDPYAGGPITGARQPAGAGPGPQGAAGPGPHGAAGRVADAKEVTVALLTEHDIPRARQVAREICETLGTRALTQQRLVTIVSELGRNMVLYAGGGRITLRPPTGASRRVVVLAVDQGPGIANLSEIMAGKYKSRSGLGLGIVGTKRLADSFQIDTGRHGTAISVEVIV